MKKAIVVINEQHNLMAEQQQILDSQYESWQLCEVPASGWTLEEQKDKACELACDQADKVMASPVPYLLMSLAYTRGVNSEMSPGRCLIFRGDLYLFHNDKREKKELPGGKVISVVAQTGWQLVTV
jgi:hypothetical protein